MRASFLIAIGVLVFASGCGGGNDHDPISGEGALPPSGVPQCDNETGCPCLNPGQAIECKVYRRSGDYVACSVGQRVCGEDGKWGACTGGDQVAQ
jgi:hypothetical protein